MYSFGQLKSALDSVQDELIQHHFYDHRLAKINVIWVAGYGIEYGHQQYRASGDIVIYSLSKSKLRELFGGPYVSLKDILRHEYAHAFAHTHRKLMKTAAFKKAFWTHHDDYDTSWIFDPTLFVSAYAASSAMEDFAETFMYYLEYSGILPLKFKHPAIQTKWKFISMLSKQQKINTDV
jgi:hypothetical protein